MELSGAASYWVNIYPSSTLPSLLLGQHLPFWYPPPDLGPHTLNSYPPLSSACLPALIFWMCVK